MLETEVKFMPLVFQSSIVSDVHRFPAERALMALSLLTDSVHLHP